MEHLPTIRAPIYPRYRLDTNSMKYVLATAQTPIGEKRRFGKKHALDTGKILLDILQTSDVQHVAYYQTSCS
jgi:hypothetical protein